ncbi:MAG: AI-2E family transporter [Lachnospiraceae bacterium]|nr:AI-2E family transporter [Lachnospiraceae bacterium]
MRFKVDRKYINMGITAFFVIIASIAVCFVMFNFSSFSKGFRGFFKIMLPIFNGFLITYLFSPLLDYFDGNIPKLLEKIKIRLGKKSVRNISIFCTMLCIILTVYLFISILVPQLVSSINSIAGSFPTYYNNLMATADKVFSDYPEIESYLNQNSYDIGVWISDNLLPQLKSIVTNVSTGIASGISSGFSFLWNLLLGMILSCYIMGMREHFYGQVNKIFNALFTTEKVEALGEFFHFTNKTFQDYIKSSLIDSLLIGGICFVLCVFINIPYPVLISVIVGVTNIIPFFGPYLGAIPSAIIILLISPIKALYFLIMILILQQCDGNIIKPKLFGDSTGLSGFWVIFSILVGGGFFGALGMYLGVPTFAVIYALLKRKVNRKLESKGLPTAVEHYMYQNGEKYK